MDEVLRWLPGVSLLIPHFPFAIVNERFGIELRTVAHTTCTQIFFNSFRFVLWSCVMFRASKGRAHTAPAGELGEGEGCMEDG